MGVIPKMNSKMEKFCSNGGSNITKSVEVARTKDITNQDLKIKVSSVF